MSGRYVRSALRHIKTLACHHEIHLHVLLVPLEMCKAAEVNWPFGPGLTPTLNHGIIMVEQDYLLCWSCLLTGHYAALAFFRSVTDQPNDSQWVAKKPTNDNPLHFVE